MTDNTMLTLQETIATKVRKQFIDLLPEDKFLEYVKKEVNGFLSKTTGYNADGNSPFSRIIKKELENIFTEKVKGKLKEIDPFASEDVDSAIVKYSAKLAPLVSVAMASEFTTQAIQNLKTQLIGY